MKSYLPLFRDNTLFAGIDDEHIEKLIACLSARKKTIHPNAFLFQTGDPVDKVYLLVSGCLHILDEDFWGNRSIVETMHAPIFLGEAYAFSGMKTHLVSVMAAEESVVFSIDPKKLFEICPNGCQCHHVLIENAARILSTKVVRLTEKLGYIAKRSTREKILSYLSMCARREQSNAVNIPYSRQELADYLCVERSALSHELSKMRADGIIQFRKNHFELTV